MVACEIGAASEKDVGTVSLCSGLDVGNKGQSRLKKAM